MADRHQKRPAPCHQCSNLPGETGSARRVHFARLHIDTNLRRTAPVCCLSYSPVRRFYNLHEQEWMHTATPQAVNCLATRGASQAVGTTRLHQPPATRAEPPTKVVICGDISWSWWWWYRVDIIGSNPATQLVTAVTHHVAPGFREGSAHSKGCIPATTTLQINNNRSHTGLHHIHNNNSAYTWMFADILPAIAFDRN